MSDTDIRIIVVVIVLILVYIGFEIIKTPEKEPDSEPKTSEESE